MFLSGQEAFVDNIISALAQSFTAMKSPSRELVYQTLEKLIQEQKIYQTSRGYFVVTPDTYRFMNAGSSNLYPFGYSSNVPTLDALINSYDDPGDKKVNFSRAIINRSTFIIVSSLPCDLQTKSVFRNIRLLALMIAPWCMRNGIL